MKTAFPPIVADHSRVLILGSMPGEISLVQQQYYAHPRNAFWWIMDQLLGIPQEHSYAQRIAALRAHGIALWDVLHRCERTGSLDSAIQQHSAEANDFALFLSRYDGIRAICFNGKSVQQMFQRHVIRGLGFQPQQKLLTLPSTSPANARLRPDAKLNAWAVITQLLQPD